MPNGNPPGYGPNAPSGQNGQPPQNGAANPNGSGPGAPNGPGAPGGNAQSPFAGAKSDGAEAVAQQFYEKLMAGEANGAEDLYSNNASGKARSFRDGKATESMIEELKTAFTKVKLSDTMVRAGTHIVLLAEGGGTGQGSQPGYGAGQPGSGDRPRKKAPPGMKVQITIVSEHGKLLIKDIVVRDH
jgi:hypothetical protein